MALLEAGATRLEAARRIGIHAATISRQAHRDVLFLYALEDAERLAWNRKHDALDDVERRLDLEDAARRILASSTILAA